MGYAGMVCWLKLIAPGLVDRFIVAFLKAAVRRGQVDLTQAN
jgi:hypothetical protein